MSNDSALVVLPGSAAGVHALATGNAAAGLGVPKPFESNILLLEGIHVAGTTHTDNIDELIEDLSEGARLGLRHQPDNRHDCWSVEVLHPKGDHLGFLPAGKNEMIARLLDGGKSLFAQVKRVQVLNGWAKIAIEVYLND